MITIATHGVTLVFKAFLGWGMLAQSVLGWYAAHPDAAAPGCHMTVVVDGAPTSYVPGSTPAQITRYCA